MRSRSASTRAGDRSAHCYRDRREAGATLAARLGSYAGRDDVTVLGLARGGMPVAAEIASRLGTALDVLVVRKLGIPWAPEIAFGALGPDDVLMRTELADRLGDDEIAQVVDTERAELARRDRLYRSGRPPTTLTDRVAVLTDDGLATGATARAAIGTVRHHGAARVVLAVPVSAPAAVKLLRRDVDELVCPLVPDWFEAVGQFYRDFHQVSDAEVQGLLP